MVEPTEPTSSEPRVIDLQALDRLSEWGGPKLVKEMIQLFLENSSERLSQIDGGLERGDARAVERAAHSLKSSAANIGALEVSRLSQQVEDLAGVGELEGASALRAPLRDAYQRAGRKLRALREEAG